MDYTTLLEILLCLVAMAAFGFSLYSLRVSRTDHIILHLRCENGLKHLTITARLIRDLARVGCSGLILLAAVVCLWLPPDHDWASLVLKLALLGTAFLLTLAVVADFRWRQRIDRALQAQEEQLR